VANRDIAAVAGRARKARQVLVVFAAESRDLLANAKKKLADKRADMVVANDISRSDSGFDAHDNRVTLVRAKTGGRGAVEAVDLPLMPKSEVAAHVLTAAAELLARKR